jgi:hypothetical protein
MRLALLFLCFTCSCFAQMQGWWNAVEANQVPPSSGLTWPPAALANYTFWYNGGQQAGAGPVPVTVGNATNSTLPLKWGIYTIQGTASTLTNRSDAVFPWNSLYGDTGTNGFRYYSPTLVQGYLRLDCGALSLTNFTLVMQLYSGNPTNGEGIHGFSVESTSTIDDRLVFECSTGNAISAIRISPNGPSLYGTWPQTWYWIEYTFLTNGLTWAYVYDTNLNFCGSISYASHVYSPVDQYVDFGSSLGPSTDEGHMDMDNFWVFRGTNADLLQYVPKIANPTPPADYTTGLIIHYNFPATTNGGYVLDTGLQGLNATNGNAATLSYFGDTPDNTFGYKLISQGNNVALATTNSVQYGNQKTFTVCGWYAPGMAGFPNSGFIVESSTNFGNNVTWVWRESTANKVFFEMNDAGTLHTASTEMNSFPTPLSWMHYAWVCDYTAGTITLYTNGVLDTDVSHALKSGTWAATSPVDHRLYFAGRSGDTLLSIMQLMGFRIYTNDASSHLSAIMPNN